MKGHAASFALGMLLGMTLVLIAVAAARRFPDAVEEDLRGTDFKQSEWFARVAMFCGLPPWRWSSGPPDAPVL